MRRSRPSGRCERLLQILSVDVPFDRHELSYDQKDVLDDIAPGTILHFCAYRRIPVGAPQYKLACMSDTLLRFHPDEPVDPDTERIAKQKHRIRHETHVTFSDIDLLERTITGHSKAPVVIHLVYSSNPRRITFASCHLAHNVHRDA